MPPTPAFLHPNAALVDDCVHCGFCLPVCPTYALWSEEADSPRGRIYLLKIALEGAPLTDTTVSHFDRCLGCMACVSACPSGVSYDQLILDTRAQIETDHQRPWHERLWRGLVFSLFCYPRRLTPLVKLLRLYQRFGLQRLVRASGLLKLLPQSLQTMEQLAPRLGPHVELDVTVPAKGERRGTVGLLTGCVQSVLFSEVNAATARVLSAEGFDVVIPQEQGCCGALSEHSGRRAEAQRFARETIELFERAEVQVVVVNAAGCGSAIKDYGELLADDALYRDRAAKLASTALDITEFLADVGSVAPRQRLDLTIAYHDACHLSHAQNIRAAPRELLREIPGVDLREIEDGEICCGSAGVYNIFESEAATSIGEMKARSVQKTQADILLAGNPGCLMQINAALARLGTTIAVAHTIIILDASIRGLDATDVLEACSS